MMSFRDGRLAKLALPAGTVWLLTDIAEAKGRQDLYARQAPQLLKALRETALIQSVESSNRIEGVTVASARLRPLVVEELCVMYRQVIAQGGAPPLVAVAGLVLDFLCVHPFRDGNGRVVRLLT